MIALAEHSFVCVCVRDAACLSFTSSCYCSCPLPCPALRRLLLALAAREARIAGFPTMPPSCSLYPHVPQQ